MSKKFQFEHGYVTVIIPENYNDERLKKATEDFLRKIIELDLEEELNDGDKN